MSSAQTSNNDPMLALINHYFFPARLMHDHVHHLRDHAFKDPNGPIMQDFLIYMKYWLSALYVVIEGYREIDPKNAALDALIASHGDSLRLYRNGVFHFQKQTTKNVQFHGHPDNRLNWAEDIHTEFENFFCAYTGANAPGTLLVIPLSVQIGDVGA